MLPMMTTCVVIPAENKASLRWKSIIKHVKEEKDIMKDEEQFFVEKHDFV